MPADQGENIYNEEDTTGGYLDVAPDGQNDAGADSGDQQGGDAGADSGDQQGGDAGADSDDQYGGFGADIPDDE
jgi:hypothetical protein